jgi:hypothetical protein
VEQNIGHPSRFPGYAPSPAGGRLAHLPLIGDGIKKAGAISISDTYTQLATGVMDVQLGGLKAGSQYSQVNITGTATLSGTLNINPLVRTIPPLGTTFTILTHGRA